MTLLRVAAVGSKELNAAGNLVRRYPDQDLTLADAAGVELGEVLSITELSGFLPIKVRAEFDAEVTSVPVQSGELSVTVQVQVVFKIR